MSAVIQLPLSFDAVEESILFHEADSRGFVALCTQPAGGKFKQHCYRVPELALALSNLEGSQINAYTSIGEFKRWNRQIVNLTRIGACFIDLDIYNSPAAGWHRDAVLREISRICVLAGIPGPSVINFSGAGYQCKWGLKDYLPSAALPRWNLVQSRLVAIFASLGADPNAKDASRITRVPGTLNTKRQAYCEVVHFAGRSLDTATAHSFDLLADTVLPVPRAVLQERRKAKLASGQLSLIETPNAPKILLNSDGDEQFGPFNRGRLAWDRLCDLRKLGEMRGGVPKGMRNTMLLIQAAQLALSGNILPGKFRGEVRHLQIEISKDPEWLKDQNLLVTLENKVKAHLASERVELHGSKRTPIYTYSTAKIIDLLQITDDEQRQLKTLISGKIATERNTIRERSKRRAAGVAERAEYLEKRSDAAQERRAAILALHAQGKKPMQIMVELSVSRAVVTRALASK